MFGSYAYGEPNDDSDIDLLVIKYSSDVPIYKRGREIRKHIWGISVSLDIIVYTEDEIEKWKDVKASFFNDVIEKGKVIYG